MMKCEFDELVGIVTDPDCYKRIEEVYTECDFFQTKQQIAEFYKKYDMNGIERMYTGVILVQRKLHKRIAELESQVAELEVKAQQDEFVLKLQELMRMADPDVDTLTRVGENIEVKYKNGYIKSICVEADSKMAMIQDVARRI